MENWGLECSARVCHRNINTGGYRGGFCCAGAGEFSAQARTGGRFPARLSYQLSLAMSLWTICQLLFCYYIAFALLSYLCRLKLLPILISNDYRLFASTRFYLSWNFSGTLLKLAKFSYFRYFLTNYWLSQEGEIEKQLTQSLNKRKTSIYRKICFLASFL